MDSQSRVRCPATVTLRPAAETGKPVPQRRAGYSSPGRPCPQFRCIPQVAIVAEPPREPSPTPGSSVPATRPPGLVPPPRKSHPCSHPAPVAAAPNSRSRRPCHVRDLRLAFAVGPTGRRLGRSPLTRWSSAAVVTSSGPETHANGLRGGPSSPGAVVSWARRRKQTRRSPRRTVRASLRPVVGQDHRRLHTEAGRRVHPERTQMPSARQSDSAARQKWPIAATFFRASTGDPPARVDLLPRRRCGPIRCCEPRGPWASYGASSTPTATSKSS